MLLRLFCLAAVTVWVGGCLALVGVTALAVRDLVSASGDWWGPAGAAGLLIVLLTAWWAMLHGLVLDTLTRGRG